MRCVFERRIGQLGYYFLSVESFFTSHFYPSFSTFHSALSTFHLRSYNPSQHLYNQSRFFSMMSPSYAVLFHMSVQAHRFLGVPAIPTSSLRKAYIACDSVFSCIFSDYDHNDQPSENPRTKLDIASITLLVPLGNEAETFCLSALRQAYATAGQLDGFTHVTYSL